ncbi:unnamed protein product [Anisakis simplex]|uniref:KASH domain-containing protein n=1 Tax=Anisakis simplex TaxID=6269 RepID=A0A3P6RIK5_ANISI|nr:unnamed protein product [Anisakis simplex]
MKVLTQRWHDLWLRSLSVQFRIEKQIEGNFQSEQDWESDPELSEPLTKRRRVVEGSTITEASSDDPLRSEEDTIPFAEDEYESIVDSVTMIQTQTRMLDGTSPLPANESSEKEELEPQPDIGYSSGENSIHEALNEVAGLTTLSTTALTVNESNQENMIIASDFERNGCIEITSPVKSFYRTVPLDDAGVTDTETPRICVTKWSSKFINATNNMDDNNNNNDNVLTDSLIVNTEDETDIVTGNDIKEIMSMLDDDENGNLQSSQFQQQIDVLKQGTRWRELRSTQTPSRRHSHKTTSHDNSIVGDDKQAMKEFQNSCDASSEESDDGCDNIAIISNPVSESQCNSLKRPHRTRNHHPSSYIFSNAYQTLFNSSTGTINKEMDTSMLSTYSSQAQSDLMSTSEILSSNPFAYSHIVTSSSIRTRRSARRKLRARRLPRSMSDGEQLGTSMNASTYSAPPATNPSYHCRTPLRDSDTTTTAPEHSDAQTYEWDEYNPPAKIEDGWMGYDEERQDASALTLADDDFQMYLGDDVSSLIAESRASLRSAQSLINRQPSRQSLEDLRTLAKANSERLTATVVANPRLRMESLNDIDDVNKGWSAVLSTIDSLSTSECCDDKTVLSTSDTTPVDSTYSGCADDSPLPRILSKIEKFASSLKLIQEDNDCSASSLGSLSSIRSFDDVVNAIKIFTEIHSRLVEEREELRCLLNSSTFSGDLSYLIADFEPLSMGYEEAIERVEQLMNQIEKVRESWSDWADTQNNLQIVMSGIEQELNELRKGDDNSKQICSELEMCQERMNRLETVCNYLTSNLSILHDNSTSNAPALNFTSELAVYSNALGQLKARFEETLRSTLMCDKATWINDAAIAGTNQKSDRLPRRRLKTAESGTNTIPTAQTRIFDVILGNWAFQAFVLLAVMAAFAAWLISIDNRLTNNWRSSVGPHLDYIDGPPPM